MFGFIAWVCVAIMAQLATFKCGIAQVERLLPFM
jgi:hypothetical protein